MQAHISNVNYLTVFVPCTAHSLNLVGQAAVECCGAAVTCILFDFVQQLHVRVLYCTYKSLCSSDEEIKV